MKKNAFNGSISRLVTVEKRVSDLEDMSTEIPNTEMQGEKRLEKKKETQQNIQEL